MYRVQQQVLSWLLSAIGDVADVNTTDAAPALLQGKISLTNVKLRCAGINRLLPSDAVQLTFGEVRELTIVVPWLTLAAEPLLVVVRGARVRLQLSPAYSGKLTQARIDAELTSELIIGEPPSVTWPSMKAPPPEGLRGQQKDPRGAGAEPELCELLSQGGGDGDESTARPTAVDEDGDASEDFHSCQEDADSSSISSGSDSDDDEPVQRPGLVRSLFSTVSSMVSSMVPDSLKKAREVKLRISEVEIALPCDARQGSVVTVHIEAIEVDKVPMKEGYVLSQRIRCSVVKCRGIRTTVQAASSCPVLELARLEQMDLTLNETLDSSGKVVAKSLQCDALSGVIATCVDEHILSAILHCIEALVREYQQPEYSQHLLPLRGKKSWWPYAIRSVLAEVSHRRTRWNMSPAHLAAFGRCRKDYVALLEQAFRDGHVDGLKRELSALEFQLYHRDVVHSLRRFVRRRHNRGSPEASSAAMEMPASSQPLPPTIPLSVHVAIREVCVSLPKTLEVRVTDIAFVHRGPDQVEALLDFNVTHNKRKLLSRQAVTATDPAPSEKRRRMIELRASSTVRTVEVFPLAIQCPLQDMIDVANVFIVFANQLLPTAMAVKSQLLRRSGHAEAHTSSSGPSPRQPSPQSAASSSPAGRRGEGAVAGPASAVVSVLLHGLVLDMGTALRFALEQFSMSLRTTSNAPPALLSLLCKQLSLTCPETGFTVLQPLQISMLKSNSVGITPGVAVAVGAAEWSVLTKMKALVAGSLTPLSIPATAGTDSSKKARHAPSMSREPSLQSDALLRAATPLREMSATPPGDATMTPNVAGSPVDAVAAGHYRRRPMRKLPSLSIPLLSLNLPTILLAMEATNISISDEETSFSSGATFYPNGPKWHPGKLIQVAQFEMRWTPLLHISHEAPMTVHVTPNMSPDPGKVAPLPIVEIGIEQSKTFVARNLPEFAAPGMPTPLASISGMRIVSHRRETFIVIGETKIAGGDTNNSSSSDRGGISIASLRLKILPNPNAKPNEFAPYLASTVSISGSVEYVHVPQLLKGIDVKANASLLTEYVLPAAKAVMSVSAIRHFQNGLADLSIQLSVRDHARADGFAEVHVGDDGKPLLVSMAFTPSPLPRPLGASSSAKGMRGGQWSCRSLVDGVSPRGSLQPPCGASGGLLFPATFAGQQPPTPLMSTIASPFISSAASAIRIFNDCDNLAQRIDIPMMHLLIATPSPHATTLSAIVAEHSLEGLAIVQGMDRLEHWTDPAVLLVEPPALSLSLTRTSVTIRGPQLAPMVSGGFEGVTLFTTPPPSPHRSNSTDSDDNDELGEDEKNAGGTPKATTTTTTTTELKIRRVSTAVDVPNEADALQAVAEAAVSMVNALQQSKAAAAMAALRYETIRASPAKGSVFDMKDGGNNTAILFVDAPDGLVQFDGVRFVMSAVHGGDKACPRIFITPGTSVVFQNCTAALHVEQGKGTVPAPGPDMFLSLLKLVDEKRSSAAVYSCTAEYIVDECSKGTSKTTPQNTAATGNNRDETSLVGVSSEMKIAVAECASRFRSRCAHVDVLSTAREVVVQTTSHGGKERLVKFILTDMNIKAQTTAPPSSSSYPPGVAEHATSGSLVLLRSGTALATISLKTVRDGALMVQASVSSSLRSVTIPHALCCGAMVLSTHLRTGVEPILRSGPQSIPACQRYYGYYTNAALSVEKQRTPHQSSSQLPLVIGTARLHFSDSDVIVLLPNGLPAGKLSLRRVEVTARRDATPQPASFDLVNEVEVSLWSPWDATWVQLFRPQLSMQMAVSLPSLRQVSCAAGLSDCRLACTSSAVRLLSSLPLALKASPNSGPPPSPLRVVNSSGSPLWIGFLLEDGASTECALEPSKEVALPFGLQLPIVVKAMGHATRVTALPIDMLSNMCGGSALLKRAGIVHCGPLSFLCTHSVDRMTLSSTLHVQSMFAVVNRCLFDMEVSSGHIPAANVVLPSTGAAEYKVSEVESSDLHSCFPWPLMDDPSTSLTLLTRARSASGSRQRSSTVLLGAPRTVAQRLLNEGSASVNSLLQFDFGSGRPTCVSARFFIDNLTHVVTLVLLPASFVIANELPFAVTVKVLAEEDSGERSPLVETVLGCGDTLPLHHDPSGDDLLLEAHVSLPCGEFSTAEPLPLSDVEGETSVVFIEASGGRGRVSPARIPLQAQGSPGRSHYAHRFEVSAVLLPQAASTSSGGNSSQRPIAAPLQVVALRAVHVGLLINNCGTFVQVVGSDGNPVGTLGDSNLPDTSTSSPFGLVPLQTELHLYNTRFELSTPFDLPASAASTKGMVLFCKDARGIADVSCNVIVRPAGAGWRRNSQLPRSLTQCSEATAAFELVAPIVLRNASPTHKLFFRHYKATPAQQDQRPVSPTAVATIAVNPHTEAPHYTVVTSPSVELFSVAFVSFEHAAPFGDAALVPADELFSKPFPLRLHAGTDTTIVVETGVGSHHALRVAKGELCDTCFITVGGPRMPLVSVLNLTPLKFNCVGPFARSSLTPSRQVENRRAGWDAVSLTLAESPPGSTPSERSKVVLELSEEVSTCRGESWTAQCEPVSSQNEEEAEGPRYLVTIHGNTSTIMGAPLGGEGEQQTQQHVDLDLRLNIGTLQTSVAVGLTDEFALLTMERASFWVSAVRGVTTAHGTVSNVAVEDLMARTETRHALAPLSFDLMVKGVRLGSAPGKMHRQLLVDSVAIHTTKVVVSVNDHFVCKWPQFAENGGIAWVAETLAKTSSEDGEQQHAAGKWQMSPRKAQLTVGVGKFVVSDITLTLTWIRNGQHDTDILRRFLLGWIFGTLRQASLVLPAYVYETAAPAATGSAPVHAALSDIVMPMVSFYGTALVRQLGAIFGAYDIFGAPMTFMGGVVAGMGAFVAAPLAQKIPSLLKKTVSGTSSWFAALAGFGGDDEGPTKTTEADMKKHEALASTDSNPTLLQDSAATALQAVQENKPSAQWLCTDCTTIFELLNDGNEPIPPTAVLVMFGATSWAHHVPYDDRLLMMKNALDREDFADDESFARVEELRRTSLGLHALAMFSTAPQRLQPTVVTFAPGEDAQRLVHALTAKRDFVALSALLLQGRLLSDDAANWVQFLRQPQGLDEGHGRSAPRSPAK